MKKHLLILASLVLGMGQLFADNVTFKVSELKATLPSSNTNITLPYAWKVSPYHVTATIAKADGSTGTLSVGSNISLSAQHTVTVSVAGAGTLNGITFSAQGSTANITTETGTCSSGVWAPAEGTTPSSVTFTLTGSFRMTQMTVDYTPDDGYIPDVPIGGFTEPFEATPVDNLASYTGNDPYIYDKAALKFYALNSNGEYEEYGIVSEVNTLKVAGNAITEIEYIATNSTMGVKPFINTGYVHKANTRIVMECDIDGSNTANYQAPFGSRAGYGSNMYVFFWRFGGNNKGCFARNSEKVGTEGVNVPTGEKIKIDANGVTLNVYKNGETEPCVSITDDGDPKAGTTPMYFFDLCHADHADGSATFMKLYTVQIYEGETLVMDLVPAVNGEGKGGLKDKLTGTFYGSANSGEFELSADGQAMAGEAGIPVYEGKIVIYNNHEYEYFNGSWVDRGEMAYATVPEIGTDYRDLSYWSYPGSAYDGTFGVNVFDGTTNTLDPYEGKGGWEPLSFKLTNLTKGETYRASFIYSGTAWYSWSSYTVLPFFVLDNENMPDNAFNNPDAALGYIALPNTETTNQAYSTVFTANHSYALMCIQFGVVDDNSHDPAFVFKFGDIKVEKRVLPQAYNAIDWADPVKYTPLEYIENISAPREHAYTLPYTPVTATQIDMKFMVNDKSTGWSAIFSGRNIGAGSGISLYMNQNRTNFGYFTGGTTWEGDNFAPFSLNTEYTITADVTKLVVNGETYETGNTVTNATTRQLSLFANPENDAPMRGPIYYCTISEGGETVYNFKPVIRHDGVFGFYDKASRVFVLPAQGGSVEGYWYGKLDDQAYVTYNKDLRIVMVGTTAQYLPEVQNIEGATFTWTSADESIATVAADGTVTGLKVGKVMITATTDADGGWTASYELTVAEPDYKRFDKDGVGYALLDGGNGWNDSPLSAMLDNNAETKFGTSNASEAWAIFTASEPVAVQQYSIVTGADTYNYPGRNPFSWKLEGSNDSQNWTLIDEKVKAYNLKSFNKYENVIEVNGTETYKFFKFSATQLNEGFQISEFWINEQEHNFIGDATTLYGPTCTADGKMSTPCTDCYAVNIEDIPALGHDYDANGVCSRCNGKVSEVVLLPTRGNDNIPYFAKFRYAEGTNDAEYVDIVEGWADADFDDSDWDELMLPLGSFGPYHTRWSGEYNTFWFRRSFNISNPAEFTKLTLRITHDDDCAVFLNGQKIWNEFNWTGGENDWRTVDIAPADLVAGKNVLAVYIEQNFGGAYCDFGLDATLGATVEVGDAQYATFVAPCDVDFTDAEVTANAAIVDGNYVKLTPVTTVPAGTAVVVKGEEGTYVVPKTLGAVLGADNELIAATADVTADGTQYILANESEGVGFYKAITGSTITTGKGYLVITGEGVKSFYGFEDHGTGINSVEMAGENAPIYNVAGQRLSKTQKGINIVGNKKVLK